MKHYRNVYKPRSIKRLEQKARNRLITTFIIIIILGYVFLNWGLPAIIGSLSVFNNSKNLPSKTSATEDPAIAPPVLNIPFEATSSADIQIKGYSTAKSKVEIYIDDELKTTVSTDDQGSFATDNITLSLGTNNIYGRTISTETGAENKKSLPSKTIKLSYSNEKPALDISEPSDNLQIKGGDKKVKVSGKTDPQNSVTVNGSTIIVTNEGNFSTEIAINEGDNTITIIAQNPVGNSTKIERKVNYAP